MQQKQQQQQQQQQHTHPKHSKATMDNVLVMLKNRNYVFTAECAQYSSWRKPDGHAVIIIKDVYAKVTISIWREATALLSRLSIAHAIILYEHDVTSSAKELVNSSYTPLLVEAFSMTKFICDLVSHHLQPRFKGLLGEEARRVLEKYGHAGLPKFKATDPVARYYNWPRGTIVRIDPANPDMGVSWRIVI
jgi:DNA-directed RNA polymerase subunit H (RpoH/RPB5)